RQKPAGQFVEVGEPGRDALKLTTPVKELLDVENRFLDGVLDRTQTLGLVALNQREDVRLGLVQEESDVVNRLVTALDNVRRDTNESAHLIQIIQDLDVVGQVRRRRDRPGEVRHLF